MPVDFDALVVGPCLATFGEALTYRPAVDRDYTITGGAAFAVTGVFDEAHRAIEFSEAVPSSSVHPEAGVRLAEFPAGAEPLQDDELVRLKTGLTYRVVDVQPDGHGHARLVLMLAGDP